MNAIRPELRCQRITLAAHQPEYEPIVAGIVANWNYPFNHESGNNTMVLAFRPSDEERTRIAAGEDIYVALLTYLQPMQAIMVMVGKDEASEVFNVRVESPPHDE